MAQRRFRRGQYTEAATAYEEAAKGSTRESQRDFMFNAAVAWYRAGEHAKAAAILRRLVQSRHDIDASAASGLGSALYRQAEQKEGAVDAATLESRQAMLEQSAAAYQEALRGEDNADSRANLAIALRALPEVEEKALVARLMQQHGQTQPFDLLQAMLDEQRDILEACPQAFTNDTPNQIAQFEALAERQKQNGHLWIPLKGKLLGMLQGQADQNQLAMLNGAMDSIQDSMMDAAHALRDLDPAGYGPAADAESNLYGIWKQMADHSRILQEDVRRQSNVVTRTQHAITGSTPIPRNTVSDQGEALSLTSLFVQRLPDALPEDADKIDELGPDGQPDPNAIQPQDLGLTAEVRSNIVALAEDAAAAQQLALDYLQADRKVSALDEAMRSYDLLKQIEDLLPKSSSQDQQQQQQDQQEQEQQQQDSQDQQEPPPPEQQPEQEQQEPEPQNIDQEELEKLMERALEREKEFEERQRERNRTAPLSPRERDW